MKSSRIVFPESPHVTALRYIASSVMRFAAVISVAQAISHEILVWPALTVRYQTRERDQWSPHWSDPVGLSKMQ